MKFRKGERGGEQGAVLEVLEILERLALHDDGIAVLTHQELSRLHGRLRTRLADAFPDWREEVDMLVRAVRGTAAAPLPPRWWQMDWRKSEPSAEEQLLALLLSYELPSYMPEDRVDPLSDWYRQREAADPDSYPLFVIVKLVRSLVWGLVSMRYAKDGELIPLRDIVAERLSVDPVLLERLVALGREAHRLDDNTVLSRFFAIPGAAALLDKLLVLYGDLVAARQPSRVSETISYPRTPLPGRDDPRFRRRLTAAYRFWPNTRVLAKAFRIRKQTALAMIREELRGGSGSDSGVGTAA